MNMRIYETGSLVVRKVANGYIVLAKGSREDQEDNMDGEYAFTSIADLTDWMEEYYSHE
jgi:hypothetical protein